MLLDAIQLILLNIRSERQGNWTLHSYSFLASIFFVPKGGFPVMTEITRILQFFYSQRVNATSQYNDMVVQDVGNSRTIGWLQW